MPAGEWPELADDTRRIWDHNAEAWDRRMADDGNDFHQALIFPALLRLLPDIDGRQLLDIGCGNGVVSRFLAARGARVTGIDCSEALVARARARTRNPDIAYQALDATDAEALLTLGVRRFDAAVSTNALMDMAEIAPLMQALACLLKPGGPFVFTQTHPCFQTPGTVKIYEEEDRDGRLVPRHAVKIAHYMTPATYRGLAVGARTEPQHYFHRPLHLLFQSAFDAGFALDGLAEPAFPADTPPDRPLAWASYREIPPLLAARLRLVPGEQTP